MLIASLARARDGILHTLCRRVWLWRTGCHCCSYEQSSCGPRERNDRFGFVEHSIPSKCWPCRGWGLIDSLYFSWTRTQQEEISTIANNSCSVCLLLKLQTSQSILRLAWWLRYVNYWFKTTFLTCLQSSPLFIDDPCCNTSIGWTTQNCNARPQTVPLEVFSDITAATDQCYAPRCLSTFTQSFARKSLTVADTLVGCSSNTPNVSRSLTPELKLTDLLGT